VPGPTRRRLQTAAVPAPLAVGIDQVQEWAKTLQRSPTLLARLERERGWSRRALVDLELGFDGDRITVPIWRSAARADVARSERAVLQGLLRMRVGATQEPKVVALPGTRLGLLPLPAWTRERRVLLVEGPSDMLAARSTGLPAIAVPGANAWRSDWASSLEDRTVIVVMDCDRAGRQAAARIAEDLERRCIPVGIHDLARRRQDGYDVSDWLRDGNTPAQLLPPHELDSASAYRRLVGLPLPSGRAAAQPRRVERSIAAAGRSAGCRTF
jgi:Toprim domain